ncbi:hypothetical protein AK812_SmicGene18852 [Symbiodinium microadriaticum]|uniref:Uncharacterized protein n=1 Tax=Symbiodinium microadriaticum TaxID=2951 RepID=A0A1Q9DU43_SYMMI|nr:hypothetical protein AK812_SmicGene18852 [Symbiodinium microadriaticum]
MYSWEVIILEPPQNGALAHAETSTGLCALSHVELYQNAVSRISTASPDTPARLLLRTFRPTSLPAPQRQKPVFSEACRPLWQLRILCEVTAKVMQKACRLALLNELLMQIKLDQNFSEFAAGEDNAPRQRIRMVIIIVNKITNTFITSTVIVTGLTPAEARGREASGGMDSQVIGSSQGLFAGLDQSISPDKMRRVSGLQIVEVRSWDAVARNARADLGAACKCVDVEGEWVEFNVASELYKLLHIYKEDEEKVEAGALHSELTRGSSEGALDMIWLLIAIAITITITIITITITITITTITISITITITIITITITITITTITISITTIIIMTFVVIH